MQPWDGNPTKQDKRARGRPKIAWRKTVKKERNTAGWHSWNASKTAARQGKKWKESPEALRYFYN